MTKTKLTYSEYTALFFLNNDLRDIEIKAQKIADKLKKVKNKTADIEHLIQVLEDLSSFDLEDAYIHL